MLNVLISSSSVHKNNSKSKRFVTIFINGAQFEMSISHFEMKSSNFISLVSKASLREANISD